MKSGTWNSSFPRLFIFQLLCVFYTQTEREHWLLPCNLLLTFNIKGVCVQVLIARAVCCRANSGHCDDLARTLSQMWCPFIFSFGIDRTLVETKKLWQIVQNKWTCTPSVSRVTEAGQGLFGPHFAPPYVVWLGGGQRGVSGSNGKLICLRLNTKIAAMATPVQVVTTAA